MSEGTHYVMFVRGTPSALRLVQREPPCVRQRRSPPLPADFGGEDCAFARKEEDEDESE
jgi:hypothetical protein